MINLFTTSANNIDSYNFCNWGRAVVKEHKFLLYQINQFQDLLCNIVSMADKPVLLLEIYFLYIYFFQEGSS